jgi:hypothetical protein
MRRNQGNFLLQIIDDLAGYIRLFRCFYAQTGLYEPGSGPCEQEEVIRVLFEIMYQLARCEPKLDIGIGFLPQKPPRARLEA